MRRLPFESRTAAGYLLAECLQAARPEQDSLVDSLVMAVQPAGVPVALEVARALDAELDLMMVRKLGVPGQSGLAMGAVAGGGIGLRNLPLIREAGIGDQAYRRIHLHELVALHHHEILYRGFRPAPRMEEAIDRVAVESC